MRRFKLGRSIVVILALVMLIATMVPNVSYAVAQTHQISGKVWKDTNSNGIQDPGEKGVKDISVYIDEYTYSDVTDSNGYYSITVSDGNHEVWYWIGDAAGDVMPTKEKIGYDYRKDSHALREKVIVNGSDVNHIDFGITTTPYTVRVTDKIRVESESNGSFLGYLYKNDKRKVYNVYNGGTLNVIKYNGQDALIKRNCTDYHLTSIPNYDVKTTSSVNVRSSVWGSVIGSLPANKVKTVYGQRKDSNGKTWYRVWYSGGPAYIHADLTKKHYNFYTRLTDKTKVRTSMWGSTVGYLYKNDIKTVYGITTDSNGRKWYKVWYNDAIRYIYSNCTNDNLWPAINFNVKITTSALNVRDSVWGNVIGTLNYGQVKTVYGQRKDSNGKTWYRVWYNGEPAYIMSDFTELH